MKEDQEAKVNPKIKVKVDNPFELTLVSYPDFVVTKKTPKTTSMLVIMPSCEGYYVKTTKKGEETIENLTRENYIKFAAGMEPIIMPEDFWLPEIEPGAAFFDLLSEVIFDKDLVEIVHDRCFPSSLFGNISNKWGNLGKEYLVERYQEIPILMKEFMTKYPNLLFWTDGNYRILSHIQNKFGINNARDFVETAAYSLINLKSGGYWRNVNDNDFLDKFFSVPMKYSSFRDYVLYDAYTMGYGESWDTFLRELTDTWSMQVTLYGTIKEKYPESLPTYHHQLSFKVFQKKNLEDSMKITARAEELDVYNVKHGKLSI